MRPYETEVLWLKKLVSGYFVSEQHIKYESLVGVRMVTKYRPALPHGHPGKA